MEVVVYITPDKDIVINKATRVELIRVINETAGENQRLLDRVSRLEIENVLKFDQTCTRNCIFRK